LSIIKYPEKEMMGNFLNPKKKGALISSLLGYFLE